MYRDTIYETMATTEYPRTPTSHVNIGIPPQHPFMQLYSIVTQHKTAMRVILVSFLVSIGLLVSLWFIVNLHF
jgi:hypothetical protein